MGLAPLETVRDRILSECAPLPARRLALAAALGCVTAEVVTAGDDVPPFANTAMDGFAVRAADTKGAPRPLQVVGTLAAGAAPDLTVGPGEAVRIMTGAPIPPGADAVVMVERTASAADGRSVIVEVEAVVGQHVRGAGEDLRAGEEVFEARTELSPAHLGVLASLGYGEISVFPPARVGVLSTGDELVEAGEALRPGQIRDSNRPVLVALARLAGCQPVDLGRVPDDPAALGAAIEAAVADCDAVLTSGGVSVGDFDHMKAVLDRIGEMHWWQVAIKPAKPLAFGLVEATPVFGLPGNPVSSMVSFELFARPALRQMMGHRRPLRPEVAALADEPFRRRPDGKLHLVRVVASPGDDGRYHLRSAGAQGSHQLTATARANALALLPDGDGVGKGATLRVMLLDG